MEIFASAYCYLESTTDVKGRIDKLTLIIDAHYDKLLEAVLTSHIDEYWLDDGQSKIKTKYRSQKDVLDAVSGMELLRDRLIVKYNKMNNGSVIRLMDSRNTMR